MARYSYACPMHSEFDVFFPMGEAPESVPCEHGVHVKAQLGRHVIDDVLDCGLPSPRVYSFNFQEDRRRMRVGTSPATGKPFAQSRQEERMIEQASGVNFASKADLLPHERQAIEYQQHVASGGERVENAVTVPVEPSKPLRDYIPPTYRRREFDASTFTPEHQEKQYKEILAKAQTS